MNQKLRSGFFLLLMIACLPFQGMNQVQVEWPETTGSSKPWTRWWWPGNAVDTMNIKRELKEMADAGIGGVEITSIYGVKGEEERFIEYLSPSFSENLEFTIKEANKLGMGIDVPPGSGWRLGGPFVPGDKGLWTLKLHRFDVVRNENWQMPPEVSNPTLVSFVGTDGLVVVPDGAESFVVPANGKIYVVERLKKGDMVKRASAGGQGLAIDTFNEEVTFWYLNEFWQRLGLKNNLVRSYFHDSFEYTGDFTPGFSAVFKERRGYNLAHHLHILAGDGDDAGLYERILTDYRQTLGELVLESFMNPMKNWSHRHGSLFRNQGHGSPGNVLDIYAAADIPETEIFGRIVPESVNVFVNKFASSAAHITGKKLVSAESYTWLDEHFTVTPADMMRATNRLFLAGVNHIIFHGTCYSPADAQWPGWLFYASSQVNNRNPLWRHMPDLFTYINRAQSVLQNAESQSDLLVYWPYYDVMAGEGKQLFFSLNIDHGDASSWFDRFPLSKLSNKLMDAGYSFDYISDKQLMNCSINNGDIIAESGATYKALVLPAIKYLPVETMQQVHNFISAGGKVIFDQTLPESVPGLHQVEERQKLLDNLKSDPLFSGNVGDAKEILRQAGIKGETALIDAGFQFVKFNLEGEVWYMVANCSESLIDEQFELNTIADNYILYYPENGEISKASVNENSVSVQLEAERIVFIRCTDIAINIPDHQYFDGQAAGVVLEGLWKISFLEGGPVFPGDLSTRKLVPWNQLGDENVKRFSGTAKYTMQFVWEEHFSTGILDLGEVYDCAQVWVNGKNYGSLLGPTFRIMIDNLVQGTNVLQIEVTNTAANRIRDLDIRGVDWKRFYDINFVNIDYKPFDASDWKIHNSGLAGVVKLIPIQQ